MLIVLFFFFKQKTAYEMRISDWSSDVCSSDLIEDQGFPNTIEKNYLEVRKSDIRQKPSLIIMNPPFNIDSKTKEYIKANYGGRPLLPEVWFLKALELFGTSVPIAMFTPYGFRSEELSVGKECVSTCRIG